MTDAIILFSHGSLLCGAGENLKRVAALMQARGDAPIVVPGYLNYSEPLLADALDDCAARGAREVTIVPYFLVAGKFVQIDLPRAVRNSAARFPDLHFKLGQPMGAHPALADGVLRCAGRGRPPVEWRAIWNDAPRYCRPDMRCPLFGTGACAGGVSILSRGAPDGFLGETLRLVPPPLAPPSGGGEFTPRLAQGIHALLIMVHGSPRPESNDDVRAVAAMVRAAGGYAVVQVGFMECNEPAIPEAIELCVAAGAASVVAVPYFLHSGNHVADDLPNLLALAQARHRQVEFALGDYLGHDEAIADVLRDRAREALPLGPAARTV